MTEPASRKNIVAGRPLGTMVTYGVSRHRARRRARAGHPARCHAAGNPSRVEWLARPGLGRAAAADRGLSIHSAHGCWGGRGIRARRVDLGTTDRSAHRESVDDLKRCVDWLAGSRRDPPGRPSRRPVRPSRTMPTAARPGARALGAGRARPRDRGVIVCVENMPPGVYPGSRMADLADLLARARAIPSSPWRSTPGMPT